ncbi:MAG: hypothetical protein EXS08_13850 [Planctomycetes bacterium]|nr:hypothetical protein [Planctomycetota bacterium]
MDVNEWRAVAGELHVGSTPAGSRHAVLWNPGGSMVDLRLHVGIRRGRASSGACGRPLELDSPRVLYALAMRRATRAST